MAVESRRVKSNEPGSEPPEVAIDARWLWNRDHRALASQASPAPRSRSMLDGCGIETGWRDRQLASAHGEVSIDARWLWDRDSAPCDPAVPWSCCRDQYSIAVESRLLRVYLDAAREALVIDARWLWDRDSHRLPPGCSMGCRIDTRSMLRCFGAETGARDAASYSKALSRSMLRCFGAEIGARSR